MKLPSVKFPFLAAIAVAAFLAPGLAPSAEPKILRFAFQGELKSVDPYQINESFSLSVNGAVYEGLIRRGPDMRIEPCLGDELGSPRSAALALSPAQGRQVP